MAFDNNGNIVSTGYFIGSGDFNTDAGVTTLTSYNAAIDVYVHSLDTSGNFLWALSFGGYQAENPNGITIDANGNIFIAGLFYTTVDFDPGIGIHNVSNAGGAVSNAYILKLNPYNLGTNIQENNTNNQLSVYPNPNNGMFTVQATNEGIYSIMNELGQTIQQVKLNSANNYTITIENLSTGMYFIVGYNDGKISTQKVVVTK